MALHPARRRTGAYHGLMRHVALTTMLMRRRQTGVPESAPPHSGGRHAGGHAASHTGTSTSVALWATPLQRHMFATPIGPVLLAASDAGLAGLWFEGQKHDPAAAWRGLGHQAPRPSHPVLQAAEDQLQAYFEGRLDRFDLPLDLSHGTPFQRQVWQALTGIGRGQTTTYSELAARIGAPQAARAVGAAVGRNPISVIVPCHRVLGAHGALTGYAGGLERKRALLRLEGLPA